MFLPNRMEKVNVLVYSKYLTAITEALGNSGLLHLTNAADESKHQLLKKHETIGDIRTLEQMLSRCEVLLEALGIDENDAAPAVNKLTQSEIGELFEKIDRLYCAESDKITKLVSKRSGVDRASQTLAAFPFQSLRVDTIRNFSQLYLTAGTLDKNALIRARQALSEDALFIPQSEASGQVLVLTTRKKHFAVEDMLGKFGFKRIDLPDIASGSVAEKRIELQTELEELRMQINDARLAIIALGEEYGGTLLAIRKQLHGLIAIRQAQGFFGQNRQLYCISGWVPAEDLPKLQRLVEAATDGTGLVESTAADRLKNGEDAGEVPVQLSNNRLVKPFRLLVTGFGIPNYHELDPSFFVGLTFLVMFGYMFGDVGQGLVLCLAGLWMHYRKKYNVKIHDMGSLLFWCGISAVIFGTLYGSVFGNEELLHPLWVAPMKTGIFELLKKSVLIGVIFLSVSLIINIINHFRARKFFEGTFDKYGLLGLIFYWACLITAVRAIVFTRPVASWEVALIVAPLVLLFIGHPIHNLIHHHSIGDKDNGAINVIIGGAIEIMETLTGYLSGTVSFVRVGAYAISHAALCLAIYTIMELFNNDAAGTVLSLTVAILGNLIIIVFEGMVAAIQCIRLEYYEMFSRYFQGGGVPYKPFKIK